MSRVSRSCSSEAYSRSPSPSRYRPHRSKHSHFRSTTDKTSSILKTSLVFLGAVGAATLLANKFWPKGMLYGEKGYNDKKGRRVRVQNQYKGDTPRRKSDDQLRASRYRSSEDVPRRPGHHRYEGVSSRRGFAYEPEYILPRPRSADRRRPIEVEKGRHLEDDRSYINPDYTRDGGIPYDAYDGYETTWTQGAEGAVPRPGVYMNDDPPHPRSARIHRTKGYGIDYDQ
ncbi:hypothetical protein HD806DRAFT_232493 [Xylariaceae sp. AK1471]|nr:hypothetical protein HD806DRAFT_232493 [Xylariaceae sp. AK1471]